MQAWLVNLWNMRNKWNWFLLVHIRLHLRNIVNIIPRKPDANAHILHLEHLALTTQVARGRDERSISIV